MTLTAKRFGFIALISLFVSISIITVDCIRSDKRYSKEEYVHHIHEQDSIEITQKRPLLAKHYLINLTKDKDGEETIFVRDYDYCDSLNAYKVFYSFEKDNKTFYKTAWVKINFKINNGNYIVKPQIIRLISWKDKK